MFSDTPAVVLSSLAHPLIPGLNFLKLTKSKTEFKTNNIEIGSKIYPAEVHCITSSNSTIIIATSDVYWLCQLLLNKKTWGMVIFTLITAVALMAVASHTHCHFKPPFKKQEKSFDLPACNLTWKELLAYSTSIRFTVKSQTVKSKKTPWIYLLYWARAPVLAHAHLVCDIYCVHTYLCHCGSTQFCFQKLKSRRLIFLINCWSNLTINMVRRMKKMRNEWLTMPTLTKEKVFFKKKLSPG